MPRKWKTIRCIVEYRTPTSNFSERDLCKMVQGALDAQIEHFPDSKPWAKQFTFAIRRMKGMRPAKLAAIIKAQEKLTARLKAV